jgi:alanine racemase
MDQTLVDVTALRGRVALGDEVVLVGRQGADEMTVADIADRLGTITYEVTTAISARVPRVVAR